MKFSNLEINETAAHAFEMADAAMGEPDTRFSAEPYCGPLPVPAGKAGVTKAEFKSHAANRNAYLRGYAAIKARTIQPAQLRRT